MGPIHTGRKVIIIVIFFQKNVSDFVTKIPKIAGILYYLYLASLLITFYLSYNCELYSVTSLNYSITTPKSQIGQGQQNPSFHSNTNSKRETQENKC